MKNTDVCGIGAALVDVLLEVKDEELNSLELTKGSEGLVDLAAQETILNFFAGRESWLASGGSVANSMIALAQLGGKGALITCTGMDLYGRQYEEEFLQLGIKLNPSIDNKKTGTCVCLVTPDAERTMRACLGVSSELDQTHVNQDFIKNSKWLFIEGYCFGNSPGGPEAISKAIEIAKQNGTKVALTLSEDWVWHAFGEQVKNILPVVDLMIANEKEAKALTGGDSAKESFDKLCLKHPSVAVTAGADGGYLSHEGEIVKVAAFPCQPKDLTGAGDMFAGSLLYGLTNREKEQLSLEQIGRAANFLAMKVITQVGARLTAGTRGYWEEINLS